MTCTGFMWLRIRTNGGILWSGGGNKHSGCIKCGDSLDWRRNR
jgi:hypothetical protein